MLNYIKAELYRNFNRMYFWNFTLLTSATVLFFIIIGKIFNSGNLPMLLHIGIEALGAPIFLVLMTIDMVSGEEIKNLTLKNSVSFGIPRSKIVLSKIIVTVILSLIAAIIILAVFLGSGAILFGVEGVTSALFKDFTLRLLGAIPLWIGALSVGTFLSFIFTNYTLFSLAYAAIFVLTRVVLQFLSTIVSDKFIYIHNILITSRLNSLSKIYQQGFQPVTTDIMIFAVTVGVAYTVVFTILTILYFSKKEVK